VKGREKWRSERGGKQNKKMIKYSIAYEICEPNLEWNSDKSQNKKNYKEFDEVDFFEFFFFFLTKILMKILKWRAH